MTCDRCGREIEDDDIIYIIEVLKSTASDPTIGTVETEITVCEDCGDIVSFNL